MIVELGDQVRGKGIYPGGQSGNPGSGFYSDMIAKWARGEYHELVFLKNPDENPEKMLHQTLFQK